MLSLPLLALTLAIASPAETLSMELSGSGYYGHTDAHFGNGGGFPSTSGAVVDGGGGNVGARVFFSHLTDDDAAPSLQPFLQRVGFFFGSAGGSRLSTVYEGSSDQSVATSAAHVSLAAGGYFGPGRAFYADGGLTIDYSAQDHDSSNSLRLTPSVALGGRWRDLLIDARWQLPIVHPSRGDFSVPFWGNVGVEVYGVAGRRLELGVSGWVLDGGASASGFARVWLARRFGIGATVDGGASSPARDTSQLFFGGAVDFTAWLSTRVALSVSYHPGWTKIVNSDETELSQVNHTVVLGMTVRL
jgi:hypothetical protein